MLYFATLRPGMDPLVSHHVISVLCHVMYNILHEICIFHLIYQALSKCNSNESRVIIFITVLAILRTENVQPNIRGYSNLGSPFSVLSIYWTFTMSLVWLGVNETSQLTRSQMLFSGFSKCTEREIHMYKRAVVNDRLLKLIEEIQKVW